MKNKKLLVGLSITLTVIIVIFSAVLIINKPQIQKGDKQISVTVVYANNSKKVIKIDTDADFLGDALLEKEIIREDEYKGGFYTYITDVRADYSKDKAWWCITKDGVQTDKGANELPIADGDKFEITHTPS